MQADPGGVAAAIQSGSFGDGSGSYQVASIATVYSPGGSPLLTVPLSTATVTVDRHSPNRRVCDITVEGTAAQPITSLLPTNPLSILAPFGNEIVLQAGVLTTTGWQYVPLGRFVIVTSTVTDTLTDLGVTLHCVDLSWLVGSRKLKGAYNLPAAGGNIGAELQALINSTWPSTRRVVLFSIQGTSATVPNGSFNQGEDPWEAAQQIAGDMGYELFFDVYGNVVAYPTPVPSVLSPQWAFVESDPPVQVSSPPQSNFTSVTNTLTRDGIFNDFTVSGTGTGQTGGAVSGTAADSNPGSPTFTGGPFGDVSSFVTTNLITAQAQAQAAANNALAISLSSAQQVSVTCTPNPLFDVDDVVLVTKARIGLNQTPVVLDTITHVISPLQTMTLTGRVVG